MRSKSTKGAVTARPDELFDRMVRILEQARGNVVRSVNTNMVLAYSPGYRSHRILVNLFSDCNRLPAHGILASESRDVL